MIIKCGTLVLCQGYGRPVPGGPGVLVGKFLPKTKKQQQVAEYLRADSADVFPRGNGITQVPFTVRREHATPAQAQDFRATHTIAVEGLQGTWTMQPDWPGDGIYSTLQVTGVISVEFPDHALNNGVSTLALYTITGGTITKIGV
jgi:hypothetical protein